MKIRALVAVEQVACEEMLSWLSEEDDIEVVGTPASLAEAVDAVHDLSPDLVFLDPHIPELDGFGVIAAIGRDHMPPTIVVTAYVVYAIQAFEFRVFDFLLTPLTRARFQKALERARQRFHAERADEVARRFLAVVAEMRAPRPEGLRLRVRADGRIVWVAADQIDWVAAEGNYVRLHVGRDSYLLRETMVNLMARLGEDRFFRIHRSRIVNIARIKKLRIAAGGDYHVVLNNGLRLGLSRLYKDALQDRLAKGVAASTFNPSTAAGSTPHWAID